MKITRSTVCILKGKDLSIQSAFHQPYGAGFLAQCGSVYSTIVYIIMNLTCSYIPNSGVNHMLVTGLGRVLDKSTRVQVQVLEKMTSTSTSTSTGFSKVLEYKYKYF